ncbi:MAG: hypothetical protein OIF38_16540 [Cellvibrionaceae bacterium]|nr:hypothetical protein [Cellvibrionaceae bacterium]
MTSLKAFPLLTHLLDKFRSTIKPLLAIGLAALLSQLAVAENITAINAPGNTYGETGNIDISITYDEGIDIALGGGSVTLPLTVGGDSVNATLISTGTNINPLVFRYTVGAATTLTDTDGIDIAGDIVLAGGATLTGNPSTNAASLDADATATNLPTVLVDTTDPTITGQTPPAGGTYIVGSVLEVLLTFSEDVTASGSPSVTINIGGVDRSATVVSPNPGASNTLTFRYTVVNGDALDTAADMTAITVAAGEVTDIVDVGNANNLDSAGFSAVSPLVGVSIDGIPPTENLPGSGSTAPPADGRYQTGDNLDFIIEFSEPVNVSGTPQLPLDIGGNSVNADYTSGSGGTQLTFRYTLISTDFDSDGISASSPIQLPGGATISDLLGNPLTPNPGFSFGTLSRATVNFTPAIPVNQPLLLLMLLLGLGWLGRAKLRAGA